MSKKILRPKDLSVGDVLELKIENGYGYLQYIGIGEEGYTRTFLVLDSQSTSPLTHEEIARIVIKPERFLIFFGDYTKLYPKYIQFVGNFPIQSGKKSNSSYISGGTFLSLNETKPRERDVFYFITPATQNSRILLGKTVPKEYLDLPLAGISAIDLVADYIFSNWRPRDWYLDGRWK